MPVINNLKHNINITTTNTALKQIINQKHLSSFKLIHNLSVILFIHHILLKTYNIISVRHIQYSNSLFHKRVGYCHRQMCFTTSNLSNKYYRLIFTRLIKVFHIFLGFTKCFTYLHIVCIIKVIEILFSKFFAYTTIS